jgi:hypothetical protein
MIVAGLIWSHYSLRDQIQWSARSAERWWLLSGFGLVFGAAILVCAFAAY